MFENNKFYFSPFYFVSSLIGLAAPVAAQVSDQSPVGYGLTSGRLLASSAAVLALVGVITGVLALFRPAGIFGTASGQLGAIITLAAGLIGTALGGLAVATSGGRIGTGGGLAGAIVAIALGLIALALGGLALARSRASYTARRTRN